MQVVRDCRRYPESFFEGKHLSTQKVDEDHHKDVKRKISVNTNYNEHNDDLFEDEITISELEQALKELLPTGTLDLTNIDTETFGLSSQASCPSFIQEMLGRGHLALEHIKSYLH